VQERQTKQKQTIYEALRSLNHPTATEVYAKLQETESAPSRATVFRVLGGFVAGGQALELRFAGNEVRYDYNVSTHYHARCIKCGKVADITTPITTPMKGNKAEAMDDFSVEGCVIEFYGQCKDCRKEEIS
jgi:Fe2+ or Zn2+ uptake regulation protein